jgi:hypothetical protein
MPPNMMPPVPQAVGKAEFRRRQRPRLHHRRRDLPLLRTGRTLHFAPEGATDQRLRLRLPLLCEPRFQQRTSRAFHRRRDRQTHTRFLQAQLHRRLISLFRHHPQRGLHDGADRSRRAKLARTAPLPRLYPPENDSGCGRKSDRTSRPLCRMSINIELPREKASKRRSEGSCSVI